MTTEPLPVSQLTDFLQIASGLWEPMYTEEQSMTAGGETLSAELAPMLWTADVQTKPMPLAEARALRTRMLALYGSQNTFYYYSPENRWPAKDPRGTILGASTPTILAVDFANQKLSFTGLPVGYKLSVGDMVAYDYGTPTRRALVAIGEALDADGSGVIAPARVYPRLRPGTVSGASTAFVKPAAKVFIVKESITVREQGGLHATIGFRVQQTLRAG